MKRIIIIFCISLITPINAELRSALERYTYIRDTTLIIRDIKRRNTQSFFAIDLDASSGLKKMIGDLTTATDTSISSTSRVSNTIEVLNKFANSEKYADLQITASLPIPDFSIKGTKFYMGLFFDTNLSTLVTLYNQENPTNPEAQIYLKKDIKIGINNLLIPNKEEKYFIQLYKLNRADLSHSITAADLSDDRKYFSFGSLTEDQVSYSADVIYTKTTKENTLLIEAKDILIAKSSAVETAIGNPIFMHIRKSWHYQLSFARMSPLLGYHYRKRLPFQQGVYGGFILDKFERYPIKILSLLDVQSFTLQPMLELKWLKFSYSFRNNFRNPIDKIWVNSIHSLSISIPFP